ncbi:MAG: oligopeptide transporter, OPT family, partial [Methylobacterium sp.]
MDARNQITRASGHAPSEAKASEAGSSDAPRPREITLRGIVLGAAITVVFIAANVYMGLKTGMTFSSSIPAAMISMGCLRLLGGSNILENNIVQTQASAA